MRKHLKKRRHGWKRKPGLGTAIEGAGDAFDLWDLGRIAWKFIMELIK